MLLYQFITIDDEVGKKFQQVALATLSVTILFDWMQDYFS